eukprot:7340627-Alexandrium_andersonii.AAC.1
MSASLVGSEMCIRDSGCHMVGQHIAAGGTDDGRRGGRSGQSLDGGNGVCLDDAPHVLVRVHHRELPQTKPGRTLQRGGLSREKVPAKLSRARAAERHDGRGFARLVVQPEPVLGGDFLDDGDGLSKGLQKFTARGGGERDGHIVDERVLRDRRAGGGRAVRGDSVPMPDEVRQ